jgi:hypothetical protein
MGMSMRTAVECGTANRGSILDHCLIFDATTSDVEKMLINDECRVRATPYLCVEALQCLVGSDGAYRRMLEIELGHDIMTLSYHDIV